MNHVLLTAFEPFGGQGRNASLEVARVLASSPTAGVRIEVVVLPVVAGACAEIAWSKIEKVRPDLVLALGQAGGATHVRLEDRAVNLDDFGLPDNAGQVRLRQPIIPDGPDTLRAGVEIERVLVEVRRARFAVQHSLSAGRYVCNHLYYQLLHRRQRSAPNLGALFVHVPHLPEQVHAGRWTPSMALEDQVACVRAVIQSCVKGAVEPTTV
jgi:pyroglutamyl-peptidase